MVPTGVLPEPLRNKKQNKSKEHHPECHPLYTLFSLIFGYTSQPGSQPTPPGDRVTF